MHLSLNMVNMAEGQLHPSGCEEAKLPPDLAPPPLPSFTPRTTELWPSDHTPGTFHPPPPSHLQTVTHTSHFVQHCTDHYLIKHWLQTTSSDSLIKDCSLSSLALYHFNRLISSFCTTPRSAHFCLFNGFHYLPCALRHFIYLFFLQCPYLYICIVCM